jgi:hypothetical protein
MLTLLYELPERDNTGITYVVDESILDRQLSLDDIRLAKKESA